jgi:hypothetical protein
MFALLCGLEYDRYPLPVIMGIAFVAMFAAGTSADSWKRFRKQK